MSENTRADELTTARSFCAVFQDAVRTNPEAVALRSSDGALELTWEQYGDRVRRIAAGLSALGVRRGDTVALMLTNRPEFYLVDMAVLHLGATPFSIYNTSAPQQIDYLFATAGNRVVISEAQFLERFAAAAEQRDVQTVVVVDAAEGSGLTSLADVETAGDAGFDLDAAWQAVEPEDVLTLIFTSGTTGPPKAVELTHGNLLYTVGAFHHFPDALGAAADGATVVSYLPDAHLANRVFAYYLPVATGATMVTVRDGKTVGAALATARPTSFVGVPMIWYRIKAGVEQAAAGEGEVADALRAAIATGLEVVHLEAAGLDVPEELRARHAQLDALVLAPMRAKLGLDNLRVGISGGAPISADALELLMALGLPVVEGWAMSETSGAGLINPADRIKPGTVGRPVPGTEIRLDPDGELLLRSPGVMKGYRNEARKTADAVDPDGWLHTGDIATIDEDGYVTIVDRKKELIINTAGKNISPAQVENAVKTACPLVGSVVAIGDQRPYVTALITLEPDAAATFAAARGIEDASPDALARDPRVLDELQSGIDRANQTLSRVEQVRGFTVLPTYWLPDSEELTPTMKIKRRVIGRKYADAIEDTYLRAESRTASPSR